MRWMKRGLWLLTWAAWLWLGVGLHRELPRDLGPVVCRFEVPAGAMVLGFLPEGREIAVAQSPPDGGPASIQIHDAETGATKRRLAGPPPIGFPMRSPLWPGEDIRRLGRMFGNGRSFSDPAGLHLLDLRTGEWRPVASFLAAFIALHPTRPWVLFGDNQNGPLGCRHQLAVYDWERNVTLFEWPDDPQGGPCGEACFVGDTADLVVTAHRPRNGFRGSYERYELGGPQPRFKASVGIPLVAASPSASLGSRVAFTGGPDGDFIDVVDAATGKVIFSHPPREARPSIKSTPGPKPIFPPATLSASGKAVLSGSPPVLWDVETGRPRWRGSSDRYVLGRPARDHFAEPEDFAKVVTKSVVPSRFATVAWRDLETGRVLLRCWANDARTWEWTSPDGTLAVGPDGVLNRLPYRVNWTLLALCQAALASPLVLAWLALRRGRRRAKLLGEPGASATGGAERPRTNDRSDVEIVPPLNPEKKREQPSPPGPCHVMTVVKA